MERGLIDSIFDFVGPQPGPIHVQLTGGEPTLRPDLIEAAAERAKKIVNRKVTIALQTNGTKLTNDLIKKIKNLDLAVGVSLDGPPDVNQKTRGGSEQLLDGLMALEENQAPFRVTVVVSSQNVQYLNQAALFLASFSMCQGLGLDLMTEPIEMPADSLLPKPPSPGDLEKAAAKLYICLQTINKLRRRPLRLREADILEKSLANPLSKSLAKPLVSSQASFQASPQASLQVGHQASPAYGHFCQVGQGAGLCLRPDGALFPCAHSARQKELMIGYLKDLAKDTPEFIEQKLKTPLTKLTLFNFNCQKCPLLGRCPGDCPARQAAHRRQNETYEPDTLACALWRGLYSAIKGQAIDSL
jgi:uncharacterized protein